MRILISGSSGFVGRALVDHLERQGEDVTSLVRREPRGSGREIRWNPATGKLDPAAVSGNDVVINLNGHSIAGRWTDKTKAGLRSSRLDATQTLARAIGHAETPPPLFISSSASGFYGDRGDRIVDESSQPGHGFLAELARDWENAALQANSGHTRVVTLRLGMVLGDGGALRRMLTPFKLGVGGPVGTGDQWWPWVAMSDVVGAVDHIIGHHDIDGPVNVVAPGAATSRQFARALGRRIGRPAILPAPAFALRLAFGEMADQLLLASTKVAPRVLLETGYAFRSPTLETAFRSILG